MNPKKILTSGVFCPMPWTGLMFNFDGRVKNCIRSAGQIGDIKDNTIQEILSGPINLDTQDRMLHDLPGTSCHTCYDLEDNKKRFDIISDRIFYIRELKHVPMDVYKLGNHDLQTIDVRWTNLCNFSCVYCSPEFSSRWASELNRDIKQPSEQQLKDFKDYVFAHIKKLKHVYLAGGEPLLMKQNLELLELLEKENPGVNLRINTNLSKVDTRVFEKICGFKNVHWTISVETMQEEFEYIRYGGSWLDFVENLATISQLDHKISFNMLYFLLNYKSLFDCIDYFLAQGYHPNSFIAGALLTPIELNIRHLPTNELDNIKKTISSRLEGSPGYLLEDSYRNLLNYISEPFEKNQNSSLAFLQTLDIRRGLDSQRVFPNLYKILQG